MQTQEKMGTMILRLLLSQFSVILGQVTLLMITVSNKLVCTSKKVACFSFHFSFMSCQKGIFFLKKTPLCLFLCACISKAFIQSAEINKSLFSVSYMSPRANQNSRVYVQVTYFLVLRLTQSRNKRFGTKVWSCCLTTLSFNCSLKVKQIIHEAGFYSVSLVEF